MTAGEDLGKNLTLNLHVRLEAEDTGCSEAGSH